MPASWIVEAIDVFEQCYFHLSVGLPCATPYELSLQGFEKGLDNCIIVAISFPAHRSFEATDPIHEKVQLAWIVPLFNFRIVLSYFFWCSLFRH